jgi:hypothetical protein
LLERAGGSGGRRAARIVPILHAFLEESLARLALQSLLVRTELAGRHYLLRIDRKTRPRRQEHNQSGRQKRITRHAVSPASLKLQIQTKAMSFFGRNLFSPIIGAAIAARCNAGVAIDSKRMATTDALPMIFISIYIVRSVALGSDVLGTFGICALFDFCYLLFEFA